MLSGDTPEHRRLAEADGGAVAWQRWGPYLSERAWGTVREDYSADSRAWRYFPHDHARSRVYRWNEDGLAGICDDHQYLCLALALWNERDSILKERLFGLSGPEGNHGEDVKEAYFYLDNTPTHSYQAMLYKYPQAAFPYEELVAANGRRGVDDGEFELTDSAVFDDGRYFDVFIEYAKAAADDLLLRVRVVNRGPEAAPIHLLPTLWFRNTWVWGYPAGPMDDVADKPRLWRQGRGVAAAEHPVLGRYTLSAADDPALLFTENETNRERLFGAPNDTPFVKDAFHRYLIDGQEAAVNPAETGTKLACHYALSVPPGEERVIRLRLTAASVESAADPFDGFDELVGQRRAEADAFYAALQRPDLDDAQRQIQRQALAGMLWSKQLYYFDVEQWLNGDPAGPPPPPQRRRGRNSSWQHLNNFDVISMPDKWEYPWYAAWDLAFHCLSLVRVDPAFAKEQLLVMTREWYMHPNGQLPAYEWGFGDVNPPVHAWAAWRVYKIDGKQSGVHDRGFLQRIFQKLLLNFTWWVNRQDMEGRNVFQGGFLGLDNVSLFDRSAVLPTGGYLDQSDGTAWMGFFSLEMLKIALELAREEPGYQDMATKFFEHFLAIARAMTSHNPERIDLWDEADGFFYDALHLPNGESRLLKVRSLVGLIPLLAVETLEPDLLEQMPEFIGRLRWFTSHKAHLARNLASMEAPGAGKRRLLSIVTRDRLLRLLGYMLDEAEFLSPYGIRSLSRHHEAQPYHLDVDGRAFQIAYEPGESRSGVFGGNSNWRGPVWFPINYLLVEALQRFDHYYGDTLKVEYPTGSGQQVTLNEVATDLSRRLISLFLPGPDGRRPAAEGQRFQDDPHWAGYHLFPEYFHGDSGAGLGASHQTGWTGLVANLIQRSG